MKNLTLFTFILLGQKLLAQNGVANIEPTNLIKDSEERTVTMKDGNLKNTPVTSYWQLHASGFQPTVSVGPGGYYFPTLIDGGGPQGGDLGLWVYTINGGNTASASLIAPIDLPHNADIASFEACFWDRSGQSPNYGNCDLKFVFYRIVDNSCPPEVLGTINSQPSGNLDPNCPIRCSAITMAQNPALTVNNRDYFYYVVVTSSDNGGGAQQCGNWAAANLGVRGIQISYSQK